MTKSQDYYKILGIKENATEEKIRQRWIKLMRRFHPDREAKKKVDDERLREINEAYHILKHSSTRVQYDLKRAYDRKKRKVYLRRGIILAVLPVLFVVSGLVYFRTTLQEKGPGEEASRSASPPEAEGRTMGEGRYVVKGRPGVEISESKKHAKRETPVSPLQHQVPPEPAATTQRSTGSMTNEQLPVTSSLTQQPGESPTKGPIVSMTDEPLRMTGSLPERAGESPTKGPIVSVTDEPLRMTDSLPERAGDPATKPPIGSMTSDQLPMAGSLSERPGDPATKPPGDPATKPPGDVLKAEIGEFLSKYAERYVEKDIEGFLLLFSSRAVLNQKDGLEGIRRIYTHFFGESKELRYRLMDPMVEANQTWLEIKAGFEVDQVLRKGGEKKVWRGQIRWLLSRENDALKIVFLDYQYQ